MVLNRKMRRALKARGVKQMPESRSREAIQQEYVQVCAQAGELQFKIGQFEQALEELNTKLEGLNAEFAALPKADAPKTEETVNAEAPVSPTQAA